MLFRTFASTLLGPAVKEAGFPKGGAPSKEDQASGWKGAVPVSVQICSNFFLSFKERVTC